MVDLLWEAARDKAIHFADCNGCDCDAASLVLELHTKWSRAVAAKVAAEGLASTAWRSSFPTMDEMPE